MYYIGLMSGTSLDGVDAVVYDPSQHVLLATHFLPYPKALSTQCEVLMQSETVSFESMIACDNALAEIYADASFAVIDKLPKPQTISAIGCHGQTIKHAPKAEPPYSIQLGSAFLLASKTGLPVVSQFRQTDIVLAGQGAPLAPPFHQSLFELTQEKVVVNIGGIANISYLDKKGAVHGFDTGPGNVLLDAWVKQHQQRPFDEDGLWGSEGRVSNELLLLLLDDPYFSLKPPKSLDKNYFSLAWLETKLGSNRFKHQDVQATLVTLTIQTIVDQVKHVAPSCNELIVCGGGKKNKAIMTALSLHFKHVKASDELGFDSDFIEAMMIAWYAKKCFHQEKVDLRSVTGCAKAAILGAIVYA